MRRLRLVLAALVIAGSAYAQSPPLNDVSFSWPQQPDPTIPMAGFGHSALEIGRYDTLKINVNPSLTTDVAKQLGGPVTSPLVTEINAFTDFASALKAYTDFFVKYVAANPNDTKEIIRDPGFIETSHRLATVEQQFITIVKPIDPDLYATVRDTFAGRGYQGLAEALQEGINALSGKLQTSVQSSAAFGMTASLISTEANAKALHLPGYDSNAQLATAAVPNYIPVADARTEAELNAAQTLIDTTKQLAQVPQEVQKTINDAKKALDALKEQLKTQDLDKALASVQTAIEQSARTDLGPLLTEVKAARTLIQNLTSANPTLTGDTDAMKLLNLANTLNTTADALTSALLDLPNSLNKLATDVDAAVKAGAIKLAASVETTITTAAKTFTDQQTFFLGLVKNLQTLAGQFSRNNMAVLSAENLQKTARSIAAPAELNTTLDLSRIEGDVHVQDRVQINAAIYRKDAAGNLQSVSEGSQTFVIQRYHLYPDNIRGALIFVDPRDKIERSISYQPTPAMGYYWRYGIQGHPGWNAASPSFGFTLSLLDFKDGTNVEIGIAGGVSLFRDLIWTGYGRNLQAKANYFYVGVNALALGKMITNR